MDLKLLEKLCLANAPSGFESKIRKIILSEIKGYAEKIEVDALGNILVSKKGRKVPNKKLLISAHMDEVGFIINNVTENGFLNFSCIGGISSEVVCGKKVLIGKEGIPGIIGLKPIHLIGLQENKKIPNFKDLFIDIGAKNKKEAEQYVKPGNFAVFDSSFLIQNNKIISKALDDRIGCAVLIEIIKKDLEFDTCFSFVVQEEVGLRGAKVAAFQINPDSAIIIEATTAADILNINESESVCNIDKGVVVTDIDKSTIYDKEYVKLAFSLAKTNNFLAQRKRGISGGNDSGAIHISRNGVRTIALSVPCRYLHSAFSVASIKDIESVEKMVDLLKYNLLQSI